MAMDGWYLNIKIKSETDISNLIINSYEKKDYVFFLSTTYSYLSFFEGVKILYEWINNNSKLIIECETNNIKIDYLNGFLPFLGYIYEANERKINWFYSQIGIFIVAPGEETYSFVKKNKKRFKKFS